MDLEADFGCQNDDKSIKNYVEKHNAFQHHFLRMFWRMLTIWAGFLEAPGGPKITKNPKKSFLERCWNALGILMRF